MNCLGLYSMDKNPLFFGFGYKGSFLKTFVANKPDKYNNPTISEHIFYPSVGLNLNHKIFTKLELQTYFLRNQFELFLFDGKTKKFIPTIDIGFKDTLKKGFIYSASLNYSRLIGNENIQSNGDVFKNKLLGNHFGITFAINHAIINKISVSFSLNLNYYKLKTIYYSKDERIKEGLQLYPLIQLNYNFIK